MKKNGGAAHKWLHIACACLGKMGHILRQQAMFAACPFQKRHGGDRLQVH
jgi:hypothetical protein